jgi:WD40 repeat protein
LRAKSTNPQGDERIHCIGFNADGSQLAAGREDGEVWVWDTETGRGRLMFQQRNGRVLGLAISPDGKRIASAGGDGTITLWDAGTGQEVYMLRGPEPVFAVAFTPDGHRLISGGNDKMIRVWDATPLTEKAR